MLKETGLSVEIIAVTTPNYQYADSNGEMAVELAARTCYRTEEKLASNPDYIPDKIRRGHYSVLEHASASIKIKGVSRALTHQLVRHRHFAFAQESQRFVTYENPEYVIPPSIQEDERALELYREHMEQAMRAYKMLMSYGIPKQDARFVFPNGYTSTIQVTGNLRCWLEYFQKRLDRPAQWEIKNISKMIWTLLTHYYPNVFTREALESVPKRDFSVLDEE